MSFVANLSELVADSTSGLHACPHEWPRVPLGRVAKVLNGYPFASGQFGAEGVPVIRIRDVVRGATNTKYAGAVPEGYWIEPGDLIVGMDGDFAIAQWRSERALLNQRVCKIIPDETKVDLKYLRHVLPGYLDLINANTPSVTVKHLSSRTLAAIPVPLPPIETQRRIVARIDALFDQVEDGEAALGRARADLGVWRKALLKAAVTGELTTGWREANPPTETGAELLARILAERRARWLAEPRNKGKRYVEPAGPDAEGLPRLPDGWVWASLAQVSFVSGGLTVDAKRKPANPVELPYLRVANVQRGFLDLRVLKTVVVEASAVDPLTLQAGDILLNEGGDRDKIGRGWVFEGQIEPCLHQNHVFKARPASETVTSFLVSMYLNEFGRRFFIDEGKQTTNLASISLTKVSRAPLPVPPKAEAMAILAALASQSSDGLEGELNVMESDASTLRQSILAAAFRGTLTA